MDKLQALVSAAQFDICGGNCPTDKSPLNFIFQAALPGGGSVSLLKVLLTNICINDCIYCVNQVGRDIPRCFFQSEELAKLFMNLHAKKLVQGLFLSSGIGHNASRTMEAMIKTVEILRFRYEFKGYIHLKILPGASFDFVEAGCRLANRVSINIEAPTAAHLAKLSRKKDLHHGILARMGWVKQLMTKDERLVPSGQSTQFVVGAAGETDRDILQTASSLYREMDLRRVYFSAFRPVKNASPAEVMPAPLMRQHRLYQADWMLRVYGFSPAEVDLALDVNGNLSLGDDPKLTIAQKQPWLFPVDINRAHYEELLRVPGIGPLSAKRIFQSRRDHSIDSLRQLQKMGINIDSALPFLWFKGILNCERQLPLLPPYRIPKTNASSK